jgi:uncharacterized peroxidase-related enzyme
VGQKIGFFLTVLLLCAPVSGQDAYLDLPSPSKEQLRSLNLSLGLAPDYAPESLPHSVRSYFFRPDLVPAVLKMDGQVNHLLPQRERYLVAVVVARENACDYCLSAAKQGFLKVFQDEELLASILASPGSARLSEKHKAMVDYALILTRCPDQINGGHVDRLRGAGFSDKQIFDLAAAVSWHNYLNRMSLGLGLGPDETHRF